MKFISVSSTISFKMQVGLYSLNFHFLHSKKGFHNLSENLKRRETAIRNIFFLQCKSILINILERFFSSLLLITHWNLNSIQNFFYLFFFNLLADLFLDFLSRKLNYNNPLISGFLSSLVCLLGFNTNFNANICNFKQKNTIFFSKTIRHAHE